MYQPKFSFITATYNAEKTLEQTISSILNQSYQNLEHIIVDGGSTDRTLDIIKKYKNDKRLRWISEKDNGICDAVGKGTLMATGDYINILGSDDCLTDINIVRKIATELQSRPDVLIGTRYNVDEETKLQYLYKGEKDKVDGFPTCVTEATYINKQVLEKYPYDRSYLLSSDKKILLQCILDKSIKIKLTNLPMAFFSVNGASGNANNTFLVVKECNNIYNELNMKCHRPIPKLYKLKQNLKQTLPLIYKFYSYVRGSEQHEFMPHTCENKICRWCGRP